MSRGSAHHKCTSHLNASEKELHKSKGIKRTEYTLLWQRKSARRTITMFHKFQQTIAEFIDGFGCCMLMLLVAAFSSAPPFGCGPSRLNIEIEHEYETIQSKVASASRTHSNACSNVRLGTSYRRVGTEHPPGIDGQTEHPLDS